MGPGRRNASSEYEDDVEALEVECPSGDLSVRAAQAPFASSDRGLLASASERKRGWLSFVGLGADFSHLNLADPFHMRRKGTTVWREMRAGTVTFLTMAYIIPVNAAIMSAAIPHRKDLVVATAATSAIGSALMGVLSNFPFGLAPGMGLNAYFAFNVVLGMGIPWEDALASVFFSGLLFVVATVLGLRTLLIRILPPAIQRALGAGIGLFIALIGSQTDQGIGLIRGDPITLVALNTPLTVAGNYDAGKMWAAVAVLMATLAMMAARVPGAPLVGIVIGTSAAWGECWARGDQSSALLYPFGSCGPETGGGGAGGAGGGVECFCYAPSRVAELGTCAETAGALRFDGVNTTAFWLATLTFFYNDLIGCGGTLLSVARKAGFVDENGNVPSGNLNMGFLADALSTIVGSVLGTSTVTSYIESAAGVIDGGRTGATALTVAVWFALSIPFAPLLSEVPPLASAPILVIVGGLMLTNVHGLDWGDVEEGLPAFLALLVIPLTYNIAYGIIAAGATWLCLQALLVPVRWFQGVDPFVKFKMLFRETTNNDAMVAASVAKKE